MLLFRVHFPKEWKILSKERSVYIRTYKNAIKLFKASRWLTSSLFANLSHVKFDKKYFLHSPTHSLYYFLVQVIAWKTYPFQDKRKLLLRACIIPKICYILHISMHKFSWNTQMQLSRRVLCKRCSENMQQIYRRTPMQTCNLKKKLLCNFIEITPWHGCSPVYLLHIFRTSLLKNTSGRLLLNTIFLNKVFWQIFYFNKHSYCH